jgi:hypothetical protein
MQRQISEPERQLLTEIAKLSDRVRELRAHDPTRSPGVDATQIKALEAQERTKWEALRSLRAGSVIPDPHPHFGGSHR